jgi:hypothetical protein
MYPSTRVNGYYYSDYPYYIYNGYRYRYSNFDTCNYQLVDKYTHQVIESFWGMTCSRGYDLCAQKRDQRNWRTNGYRYMCAETFRGRDYNYSRSTYDYNSNDYYDYNDYNYNDDYYYEDDYYDRY